MTETSDSKDTKKTKKDSSKLIEGSFEAILNNDFRIKTEEQLPQFDKGLIKAYRAIGVNRHSANLFALVCDKTMTPRFTAKTKYSNILNPNLCKLVQSGKVLWPSDGQEKYCFVYEDTLGNPFIHRDDKNVALGWKPESVLSNIVNPMITVLRDFRNKEITHGEIWPGNMFDGGAKAGQKINLGECLASPASSQLPSLYEPIERAMAHPMGRGAGDIADDLYSFGASLAVMLRTEDPMEGISEEKIIHYKIERGSYATLMGKQRLSGGVLELLRGLLYDDATQRWTIEDLEAWLDGRRLSPKQAPKRAKATRPIIFRGKKYIRPELLAKDLHLDADEAARLIETGELDQWVDRAIEDKMIKNRLEQAINDTSGYERGGSFNNRITVAVSHALFAEGAVRYKDIRFMPQGFNKYLTHVFATKGMIEPFIDIIKYNFITPIIRESRSLERNSILSSFDMARNTLKQKAMNAGLERCLYIMDMEAPCFSPLLDKFYVQTSRDMMSAFERICEKQSKATILFDRHVISFLSVKDRQNIDPYLSELMDNDPRKKVLGQLKVLATMQKRLNLGPFPAIAKWILGNFDPVFNYFHDAQSRDYLKTKCQKLARDGNLQGLASIFENDNIYDNDLTAFYQGMDQYQKLVSEQKLIEKELGKGNKYGQNTGLQIASVISMILSLLIMFISIYDAFLGG